MATLRDCIINMQDIFLHFSVVVLYIRGWPGLLSVPMIWWLPVLLQVGRDVEGPTVHLPTNLFFERYNILNMNLKVELKK